MKRRFRILNHIMIICLSAYLPNARCDDVEKRIAELKSPDRNVRVEAMKSLAESKDARAVEPLVATLKDADPAIQVMAARALALFKDERAIKPLMIGFQGAKGEKRWMNALLLAMIKPAGIEALLGIAKTERRKDGDEMRGMAVTAVSLTATSSDTRFVETLTDFLKDSDIDVRAAAAKALGKIGDARAVEPLKKLLADKSSELREFAKEAIALIEKAQAAKPVQPK